MSRLRNVYPWVRFNKVTYPIGNLPTGYRSYWMEDAKTEYLHVVQLTTLPPSFKGSTVRRSAELRLSPDAEVEEFHNARHNEDGIKTGEVFDYSLDVGLEVGDVLDVDAACFYTIKLEFQRGELNNIMSNCEDLLAVGVEIVSENFAYPASGTQNQGN